MIELSRHIESLLLDNDCVIVPGLGGFIAHYQSAYYVEEERIFLPPTRKVGFNPQLTMNDGLLAQSYMQMYHMDYSDAMNRISENVHLLKDALYKGETVELHGIGALHYNIYDEFEFQSTESGLLSPSLYGLDAFSMPLLSNEMPLEEHEEETKFVIQPVNPKKEIRLNPAKWLGNAVAVAVAIILFFVVSVPVENTYVDKGSYASLGTDCLFDAIRSQSMVTSLPESMEEQHLSTNKDLKPKVVKVEKVAPAAVVEPVKVKEHVSETKPVEKVSQPEKSVKVQKEMVVAPKAEPKPAANKVAVKKNKYHIIVASLTTSADAQGMLKKYNQQGYHGASVIGGNGRFRIALCSFSDKAEAYRKLNDLKKEETFKNAWMLSSK
jgi:cell division septation protein DedD